MKSPLQNMLMAAAMAGVLTQTPVLAADAPAQGQKKAAGGEVTLLRVEQRRESDGDPMITSVGLFGLSGEKMAHLDISYFQPGILVDENPSLGSGNTWALETGVGYLVPTKVPVFVGVTWVAAINRGDYSSTWYPEVGALFPVGEGILLSASRRRYMSMFGELQDAIMFGVALSY